MNSPESTKLFNLSVSILQIECRIVNLFIFLLTFHWIGHIDTGQSTRTDTMWYNTLLFLINVQHKANKHFFPSRKSNILVLWVWLKINLIKWGLFPEFAIRYKTIVNTLNARSNKTFSKNSVHNFSLSFRENELKVSIDQLKRDKKTIYAYQTN